ncbi:MAG: glycoside hydrolase family 3 N-terminal domain-containing protein [Omnitrophica WOR_2 bacterium]
MVSEVKPYQNPDLPVEQRVEDLLKRMTPEEKAAQLGSGMPFTSWEVWSKSSLEEKIELTRSMPLEEIVGIGTGQASVLLREMPPRLGAEKANQVQKYALEETRLGIPLIIHDEGLHGLLANDATSFPQSIGMASSWDPQLLNQVAQAIGKETRARGIRQLLSPTINIARDPRCGRTQETYGEDPYLTGRMAVAFVRGVQSQGVATTPKHFAANFVGDGGRDSNAIHISERLLREIYLPAFEAAVREGNALSIMAAYNSLDGLPCSCNHWLLTELLRDEWGFKGFVVSDYSSVIHVMEKHAVAANKQEVAKRTVEAGLDVELPGTDCYGSPMVEGLKQKTISMEAVDEAVRRVLTVKFLLGLFDDPYVDPDQAEALNHTEEHQALALQMAREAVVLLKNDRGLLPLSREVKSIAVIGPNADRPELGNYAWGGYPADRVVTPLKGIRNRASSAEVRFRQGCSISGNDKAGFAEAVQIAKQSQVAIVCVGNSGETENEQRDRADLALPGVQAELIQAVAATGTPTIVVLLNGAPVLMNGWIDQVGAVLEAWYPGEAGGKAVAEILFGDTNPSGKLPVSFPRAMGQLPLYYNYKPSGRILDYVDLPGTPLFPFGFGLSYTTFEYRNLNVTPNKTNQAGKVTVQLEVTNTGDCAGDEVVQLYVHDSVASVARPVKELKAFQRVHIEPKKTASVSLDLEVTRLGMYDMDMNYVVEPGEYEILVGSSSEDIRLRGVIEVTG